MLNVVGCVVGIRPLDSIQIIQIFRTFDYVLVKFKNDVFEVVSIKMYIHEPERTFMFNLHKSNVNFYTVFK